MLGTVFRLARPALFALDPEQAHEVTLKLLEAGLYPRGLAARNPRLAVDAWGLAFPNPLGIAAGFDKDARVHHAVLAMGFGFAEIGTVTPRSQPGNLRPRVFRLPGHGALINRLGFNSGGHAAALARLQTKRGPGIVGINVGANKDSTDRTADYVEGIRRFWDVASYFTVNISSPNTPGLRDLQAPAALDDLLRRVLEARSEMLAAGKPVRPIVVKLAPDIAEDDLAPVVEVLLRRRVDGIALGNTTLSRAGVSGATLAGEAGGLSGRPLFHRSTAMLARIYRLTGGSVPLIGIGGIDSGPTAIAKIEAGATLLQLYTGLVFEGPDLLDRILTALAQHAERNGRACITQATGSRAEEWAAKPLDP
jgi:dihydroorotate dehydrogenase